VSAVINARYDLAVDLALEAGALAVDTRRNLGALEQKDPMDFATRADHAVEDLIRRRVAARFGDAVIGEEDGGAPAPLVWVVDPIDGTNNYIHGASRWCVSIALLVDSVVEIGVIHAPDERRLFVARRGRGAVLNGAAIGVSHLRHGASPVVETGWSPRRPMEEYNTLLSRLIADNIEFRRLGSGALGMADVAAGLTDGYVELHINAWDVLAGLVLVKEAGGWASDFLVNDGLRVGNPILACTPEIAPRLRAVTLGVGSERLSPARGNARPMLEEAKVLAKSNRQSGTSNC
jgi:myo-inositol-1(or 4)-monophosphatase